MENLLCCVDNSMDQTTQSHLSLQSSSVQSSSLQSSREGEDIPYQIGFSPIKSFGDPLLDNSYQPRYSPIKPNEQPMQPEPIDETSPPAATKPRIRAYAMSSFSSSLGSSSIDSDMPMVLPINAHIDSQDRFTRKARDGAESEFESESEPEYDPDLHIPSQPLPSRHSAFYCEEIRRPTKTPIRSGDFYTSKALSSRATKLPSRGLSRGLPDTVSRKAGHRHHGLGRSPQKEENSHQRFEEDLSEMMDNDGIEDEAILFSRRPSFFDTSRDATEKVGSSRNRLSVELGMASDEEDGMASRHLLEVHQRLKMRKRLWKPTEKVTQLNQAVQAVQISSTDPATSSPNPDIPSEKAVKREESEDAATVKPAAPESVETHGTPHRNTKDPHHPSKLHLARSQIHSPTHHPVIPNTPSRSARELWRIGKTIHKSLSSLDIQDQRRELHDLREAAGMAPKDVTVLCDWQVEHEYRTVLKTLERKWLVKKRSKRRSIVAWVEASKAAGVVPVPEENRRQSMVITDGGFETDSDATVEPVQVPVSVPQKQKGGLSRSGSDRVRLPVVPSHIAAPTQETKARVVLPVIKSYMDSSPPEINPIKPRVSLPVIDSYMESQPQPPAEKAREHFTLHREESRPLPNPAVEAAALRLQGSTAARITPRRYASRPLPNPGATNSHTTTHLPQPKPQPLAQGFTTPRRHRITLHPGPADEAREVWSEARKRLRGLPSLPLSQQRLELRAMRRAAGFPNQELQHVRDEELVQTYRSELKVLEKMWLGKDGKGAVIRKGNAAPVMGRLSGEKIKELESMWKQKGNGDVKKGSAPVPVMGGGSGGTLIEDDEDSDYETTVASDPETPTRTGNRRPGRG